MVWLNEESRRRLNESPSGIFVLCHKLCDVKTSDLSRYVDLSKAYITHEFIAQLFNDQDLETWRTQHGNVYVQCDDKTKGTFLYHVKLDRALWKTRDRARHGH